MKHKNIVVGFVVTFLIGVSIGYLSAISHKKGNANLFSTASIPVWLDSPCVSATPAEREFLEAAASTLERFSQNSVNWFVIGAGRALSDGLYRTIPGQLTRLRVCTPADIYARVAKTFAGKPVSGRFDLYEIALAGRMQSPPPEVVEAVAQVAFEKFPVIDDDLAGKIQGDIRPVARTVLAGFGPQASKYARAAFEQISDTSSLGTGAAQVAAAAGQPDAPSRVEAMMNRLLASVPGEQPIPLATRDRLYELAWAIYFSGDSARAHVAPLIKLMGRRVQSAAPPFGLVNLHPKRMCEVLSRIYGADKSVIAKFDYCADSSPLESYPQGVFAVESAR